MHDITKLIQENRKEAYEIIKAHGGKIEFVEDIIHNDPEDDYQDDWNGCIVAQNVPWCILEGCDHLMDVAVLAVKCSEREGQVDFLIYDNELDEVFGWESDATCCNNTENYVYEFIGELK